MPSLIVFAPLTVAVFVWGVPDDMGPLGVLVLAVLTVKLLLALCYLPVRREEGTGPDGEVVVIVPVYNEDPETLRRCLLSVLGQRRPPASVVVVDDGSADTAAVEVAETFGDVRVLRQVGNRGKREALASAIRACPESEVYVTVDSDTVLAPDALGELLKPFADGRVMAVTGVVLAANAEVNVLTRLTDLRYAAAFLYERAACSALGSVLCCCGSLAAYRGRVVRANLGDFLTQRFLGRPALVGDDRRLTGYCLLEGRVVLQSTARAETLVPQRLAHYLRQQARWNRALLRESLWILRVFPRRRPLVWTLALVELVSWVLSTLALVCMPFMYVVPAPGQYLVLLVLFCYLRTAGHPTVRPHRTLTFALAPLYGAAHLALLLPIRLYTLFTMRRPGWDTRQRIEVALES
ncbi:glycosyltransferase [Nonomuraea longicatena]|uniref:Hyaluronan synthase n=1 Tax=Nonomuraea longicatena TaxID=83682 RepID=A0ABN1PAC8_9ACTN